MSASSKPFPEYVGPVADAPSLQERESREFEDRVADMLRWMGFDVKQRVEVPLTKGLTREVDQLCFADGQVVWVETKLKRNGGRVGINTLVNLWGAYTYIWFAAHANGFRPNKIWVVSNGKFSSSAKRFALIVNQLMEQEFFTLIDGRKLEKLMPGGASRA